MREETLRALDNTVAAMQIVASAIISDIEEVVDHGSLVELIRHYDTLRHVNEAIKKARKAIDDLEDRLSHVDVPDAFRREGIKTVSVDDVGRVTVAYKWGCSIVDGKKPESFNWLREGGNGGIIIETINAQTLAAFAKNEVEVNGKELPTDLFTTSLRPYTSITKV
jgi:hypothetical protein